MLERIPPLARFEESPVRRIVADRLRGVPTGGIIPYSELSALAGGDAQRDARHLIASARSLLLKERILFDAVTNVGLKRLNDIGALDATESHLQRGRRAVQRAGKTLAVCDYEALPPTERERHSLNAMRIAIHRQFSSKGIVRRLGAAVTEGVAVSKLRAQLSGVIAHFGGEKE